MEKDMQSYRLSDLVKIKNGKDHKMLSNGKYPVLGSGGIMRYVDKFLYDKPSVLLPRKGTLDNIQYCDMPFWTVDTLYYTEVNTNLANPYYLYRYLSLLDLSNLDSGTGVPSMTFDNYYGLKIFLPNIEKQTKIAQILQTLDKKITINRQINQNLEAMAKQLYDYWFVQFDFPNENGKPYKSSGGKMVWNEKLKREIPKGWNVLKLGEHCSFNKRTSNGYFNHPILYLDTSNITNNTIDELQFLNPSSDIIPSRARRLVQEGDIVYSTVRPNLKHFGIIMNPDYNMVVSTGFAVITANWSAYRYFIYQFLIQAATIENLSTIAQSAVSAYPSINTSDIENLDLVVPPDSMIEKYAKTACRLYLQIDTNYKEIKSLTKQRDELLPLLMNGQVSVNSDLSLD